MNSTARSSTNLVPRSTAAIVLPLFFACAAIVTLTAALNFGDSARYWLFNLAAVCAAMATVVEYCVQRQLALARSGVRVMGKVIELWSWYTRSGPKPWYVRYEFMDQLGQLQPGASTLGRSDGTGGTTAALSEGGTIEVIYERKNPRRSHPTRRLWAVRIDARCSG